MDGTPNVMGADALVTVPGGTAEGDYYIYVGAVGHDSTGGKNMAWSMVTVTVSSGPDATPPSVSSTVPTNGATGVTRDSDVTINWDENIDCATVNTTNITIDSGGWTLNSCSGSQAIFTPSSQASNTSYTVTVGTGVQDVAGNPMSAAYNFSYTTAVNLAPSFTSSATPSVAENQTSVITVTTSDPESDAVTYALAGTGADESLFSITSGGVLTFLAAPDYENPGDTNTDNVYLVDVQADDGNGNTPVQNLSITVTNVNDEAPVISTSAPTTATEDVLYSYDANFGDVDGPGENWTLGGSDTCSGSLGATGIYTFTPTGPTPATSCVLDIQVCDGGTPDLCDTETVTVNITAVNDPPTSSDNTVSTAQDTNYAFLIGDFALSDPEGGSLSNVEITTLPAAGLLIVDADASGDRKVNGSEDVSALDVVTVADITAGRLLFIPGAGESGSPYTTFTFKVQDNDASPAWSVAAYTMTVNVTAGGDVTPPNVSSTTPGNGATGVALNGNVTINFDEAIACGTVNTTNVTSTSPGWTLSTCSGSTATFTTSGQVNSTSYSVSVTAAVTDVAGNPLNAAPYNFSYTTVAAAGVDSTTVGAASATPGNAVINVTAPYSDDDNGNNIVLISWGDDGVDCSLGNSGALGPLPSPYTYQITSLTNGTPYQVCVEFTDGNGVTGTNPQTLTGITPVATNPLLHNSINTASTKWGGDWGTSTGKYGEFTCATCHTRIKDDLDYQNNGSTFNIKRVKASIATPDGTLWASNSATAVDVQFTDARTTPTGTGFGNDSGGHVDSAKVCEACHSQNKFHNYDTTNNAPNGGDLLHENNQDCMGCHQHTSGFDASCSGCHPTYPEPPATNVHVTHAGSSGYAYACETCHPKDHDGDATDITFSGVAATWGSETYTAASKTCSSLYCHGGATADWDAGTGGTCGDCHGDATGRPDGASEPAGGSHLTTSHQVACTTCHSHDGTDKAEHVNGLADSVGTALVSNAGTSVTAYTYGGAAHASSPDPDGFAYTGGTCSNSCHSDGNWGATGGCTFCHGGSGLYYPQGASSPDTAGEHAAHIYALETKLGYTHGTTADGEQQAMCAYCHNDSNGVGGTGHNDGGTAEVGGFNPMWDGATSDADGVLDAGKTCSNIDCHYNTTTADTWTGSGTAGCTYCHAGDASYTAASLPDVHDAHVDETADGGYNLTCVTCHSGAGSYADDHANGGSGSDVGFSGAVATTWGSESYTSASKTCSSLYCHGGATPDWDAGSGGACGDCHGDASGRPDTASEPAGGSHLTTSHQVACTTCHSHDGTDKAEHVNGLADSVGTALVSNAGTSVTAYTYGGAAHASSPDPDGFAYTGGTCSNSCHSDGNWGATGGCTFCHGGSGLYYPQGASSPDTAGEHAAHIYALETKLGYTHGTTADGEQQAMCAYCHNDSNGVGGTGHNDGGTAEVGGFNPMWDGATSDADGVLDAGKTCSNIDCHYNTTTADTWTGSGTAGCTYCHAGDASYTAASLPDVHDAHVDETADGGYNLTCVTCHSGAGSYADDHANGGSGSDVGFSGAVATTWGSESYTSASKTCSSLYCHGGATPDWDAGSGGACGDCHGDASGRPDTASEPAGGSHLTTSHQVACTTCHSHDGTDKAEHVNGLADSVGTALVSNAGTSIGGYTYGSAHASSPDPDGYAYSAGTCATISCHGGNNADWGGSLGCTGCHGNPPSTNAHLTHAGSGAGEYGYACATCHPEDHDGDATDITFSGIAAGGTYGAAQKQCSNLYCHGSATADWDGGSGGTCGDCHGDTNGRPDGASEPSGGSHLTTSHLAEPCTSCHSHDGSDTSEHANGSANANGDALVSSAGAKVTSYTYGSTLASSPDPDGFDYSGGTCANSCHGDMDWGATGSCTTCHNGGGSGATLISSSSPHTDADGAGATYTSENCDACHPQHSGGVLVPNNATVGISYTADGRTGFRLGGAATSGVNEPEICWNCHDGLGISEWEDAGDSADVYKPGKINGGSTSSWSGGDWSSSVAEFAYKTGAIASTHGTNGGSSGVDAVGKIICSYCHDVHDTKTGSPSGSPYLRGTWQTNPFQEDGAPQSGVTYTTADLGAAPRADNSDRDIASEPGGFHIEQNSSTAVVGTPDSFGGLCEMCHGNNDGSLSATEIDSLDLDNSASSDWVSGVNGHANSVKGASGSTAAARNIFDLRGGTLSGTTYEPAIHYYNGAGEFPGDLGWGYRGTAGTSLSYTPSFGTKKANENVYWGVETNITGTIANYHQFPCSKCHSPHASRLPRLMITNCLDTKHNSWDDDHQLGGEAGINLNRSLSNFSTAQNCHRLASADANDPRADVAGEGAGWNTVTPW